jgi:signal transduction histidine kinase
MSFFTNPEIKQLTVWLTIIAVFAAIIGFVIGITTGILMLIVCITLIFVFLFYTKSRYDDIAKLCDKIDNTLHGIDHFDMINIREGTVSVLQDEIYKMTIMLREKNEALRQEKSNLTESIENISHQLKTPLTSVNILLSFLSKDDLSSERRSEIFCEISGLLSRVDWLITSLLKMSRMDAGVVEFRSEPVLVKSMIKKSIESLEIALDIKDIKLNIECAENVRFLGDIDWSAEAFGNIIKNCMEHTSSGGTIEIKAEENPIYTQITLSDNGTGIDEFDIQHIFKRFYKGKTSSQSGFGIGLALSAMLLAKQNAVIKAENNKGSGACFSIKYYHTLV